MTLQYLPYFILGYYLSNGTYEVKPNHRTTWVCLLTGVLIWTIKLYVPTLLMLIINYCIAFSLIIGILSLTRTYHMGDNTKFHAILKRDGVGIYLWHVIFIYIMYYFDIFASVGIYLQIVLVTLISLGASILSTRIIRDNQLVDLIGERK